MTTAAEEPRQAVATPLDLEKPTIPGNDSRPSSPPTPVVDPANDEAWKPTSRFLLAFLTLAVLTLMVALDGTSLSVAIPVGLPQHGPRSW